MVNQTKIAVVFGMIFCAAIAYGQKDEKEIPPNVQRYIDAWPNVVRINPLRLHVGQIGKFDDKSYSYLRVEQILNENEMFVTPCFNYGYFAKTFRYVKKEGKPFVIRNFPTKDTVDGEKLQLEGTFEVVGTKTYPTSKRTVHVVEPFDMDSVKPFLAEIERKVEAKKRKEREAEEEREAVLRRRTWTDKTGKFSVSAEFIEIEKIKGDFLVKLSKKWGVIISVPMKRLCKSDQEYVRKELRRRISGK